VKAYHLTRVQSEDEFKAIINLKPGTYFYRFLVDGKPQFLDNMPIEKIGKNTVNAIEVTTVDYFNSDSSSYGNDMNFMENPSEEVAKDPEVLPTFLERALLNCHVSEEDPDQLPLPHQVMLSHVYSKWNMEDPEVMILGVSVGYEQKVSTIVYYTKEEDIEMLE